MDFSAIESYVSAMSIDEKDRAIIESFESLESWEDRYKKIIQIGKEEVGLKEVERLEDLKVKGCQSQVWMKAEAKDGRIFFQVDSDALIVKGLISLIAGLYSGQTPEVLISYQPKFISKLGLQNNLSPSRANGLMSMLKQIRFYGIAYQASARLE